MGSRKRKRRQSRTYTNRSLPADSPTSQESIRATFPEPRPVVDTKAYLAKATNEEAHLTRGSTKPDLGPTPLEKFSGATTKETPLDAFSDQDDIGGPRSEAILISLTRMEERIDAIVNRVSQLEAKAMTEWKVAKIVFAILAALATLYGLFKFVM